VESKLCPLSTSATYWRIVPAPGDCEDGEIGGMNGRGNRSTRRKPAPTPLCPPQIPLDQTQDWTRAAAVGSQRLTASAMARPILALRTSNKIVFKRSIDKIIIIMLFLEIMRIMDFDNFFIPQFCSRSPKTAAAHRTCRGTPVWRGRPFGSRCPRWCIANFNLCLYFLLLQVSEGILQGEKTFAAVSK
jgi:hypothetical protein